MNRMAQSNANRAILLNSAINLSDVDKSIRLALRKAKIPEVDEAFKVGALTSYLSTGDGWYTSPLLIALDETAYSLKKQPTAKERIAMIDFLLSRLVDVNLEDTMLTHAITFPILNHDWEVVAHLLKKGAGSYLETFAEYYGSIEEELGEPNSNIKRQIYHLLDQPLHENIKKAGEEFRERAKARATIRQSLGKSSLPPNIVKKITETAYGPRTASGALERRRKTRKARSRRSSRRSRR
jgi:hypothetical protein